MSRADGISDEAGQALREFWRTIGAPICRHPIFDHEKSPSGTLTGQFICTTCGSYLSVTPEPPPRPSLFGLP